MIKFEHGMLVLDSSASKEDMLAVQEFSVYVRNSEQERIIKLLEQEKLEILNSLGDADLIKADVENLEYLIALIKGEQK